jgi:acetyl-CoA acetyltransferase
MDIYVIGFAVHPPRLYVSDKRLEELVFDVTRAALDHAGVRREEVDHVTIAGCDELDGRSISSMLLAMPAGAYLKDEIKCTDSGLTGLCLGAMRILSGLGDLGLVVSWNKNSTAPFHNVMSMRADPFYLRPIGMNSAVADGLFAATMSTSGISEGEAADWVVRYRACAARNPRALPQEVPSARAIAHSPYVATPLRAGHQAPLSDGAVAFVIASGSWIARHGRSAQPLARLAGMGWRTDGYHLGGDRLGSLASFRAAFKDALRMAGMSQADLDVVELDSQTGYHAAAYARALDRLKIEPVSVSGGPFAQNPYFCTGLVHAAEAVLQVASRAGPIQVDGARRAAAHSAHGFAQQGNVVTIFEAA